MDPARIRIMIVEDKAAHAEAIRRAFEAAGADAEEIQVAGTLREYRESAAARAPDIAVMDLNLPDGRAVEVLTSPPESGPFPILIMTGCGTEQAAVEALKSGALDYIVKSPEAFADMPRTVARALREWTMLQERKRAEEALRRAEENFRRSLDDSPLGVRIVTVEGETVYANRAILEIYGYDSIEELRTTPLKRRYTPQSYADQQIRMEKRNRGEYDPPEYEVSIIRKNGEVRHLQVFRKEILWNGEKQFQVIYRDITERKKAEEKIAASLREKEVLLREIHHRVKNNMQIISSLLRLQSRSIEDEKMREIFNESQSRIRSMSLIHEKLYESKDFSRIDFSDYIGKMVTHLFVVYRMNPGDVHFKVEAKDIHLDITRAIPCGLIINELVSNALKYAFPAGKKGDLLIRMNKDESGKYHLLVKDTGIGLPPNFDIRTTETLGFQIVNDLVKQLDGTIELKRDEGTEFRIVF
jgi:PAS domain S-box-containing protein